MFCLSRIGSDFTHLGSSPCLWSANFIFYLGSSHVCVSDSQIACTGLVVWYSKILGCFFLYCILGWVIVTLCSVEKMGDGGLSVVLAIPMMMLSSLADWPLEVIIWFLNWFFFAWLSSCLQNCFNASGREIKDWIKQLFFTILLTCTCISLKVKNNMYSCRLCYILLQLFFVFYWYDAASLSSAVFSCCIL